MPPTLRKGARRASALDDASRGRGAAAAGERSGLVERLERARALRGREACDASRTEELECVRRKGFEESPLLRGHEDELLAVTGELARVLPTRTEYRLHTGEEWDDAAALGSEALARRAVIEKKILVTRGGGFNWEQPDHFRVVYLPRIEVLAECMDDLADFLSIYRQE